MLNAFWLSLNSSTLGLPLSHLHFPCHPFCTYWRMIIHPDLFKCKKTVTESGVRLVWYKECHDATNTHTCALIDRTESIKKDCADWARANIQADILKVAIEVDLQFSGRLVSNIADVWKSWQTDASVENQKNFSMFFLVRSMKSKDGRKKWKLSIWKKIIFRT